MTLNKTKIFSFLFSLTTLEYSIIFTTIPNLPTVFWWFHNTIFLLLTIHLIPRYYNNTSNKNSFIFVKLYLVWSMFTIFRGIFIADNYWQWKNLVDTIFLFLVPLFTYLFANKDFFQKIISFWFKYMIIAVIIFIPFIYFSEFLGRYFAPLLILLLLFPLLPFRWKLTVLVITFGIIITGLDARSNVIKLSVALGFGILYYFRLFHIEKTFKLFHSFLIILPIFLLVLGLSGVFNIFNMDQYIHSKYTVKAADDPASSLTADTRTFLYQETISSAIKHDYVIWGRTPARGYDSQSFGSYLKYTLGTGLMERFASEVSILNIFTWSGVIGAVLYFLVFFQSSYLAIYHSNNYFIKVIGLFVAFRWTYAFVEDFTEFDIQYIFLWALIAMCFSSSFRAMNDDEFKIWTRDLLRNTRLIKLRK